MGESDEKTVDGDRFTKIEKGDQQYLDALLERGKITTKLHTALREVVTESDLIVPLRVPKEISVREFPVAEASIRFMADYDRPPKVRYAFVDLNIPEGQMSAFLEGFVNDELIYEDEANCVSNPNSCVRHRSTEGMGIIVGVDDITFRDEHTATAHGSYYFDPVACAGVDLALELRGEAWVVTGSDLRYIS